MLDACHGLILGRTDAVQRGGRGRAVGNLVNPLVSSAPVCRGFMEALRFGRCKDKGEVVRLPNAVHTSIFAPTGVGKGVSCIVPFLLTCDESCVVIDCKGGENALLTAEHRRRMGHKVVILDPYKVVTQ
jgi:type IV secretion system protein VirD4